MKSSSEIYQKHNLQNRGRGFALFEQERGSFFKRIIGTNKKVVDLGCRDGSIAKYFLQENEVWAVDIDRLALFEIQKKLKTIKTVQLDLNEESWDLPKNYFDCAVMAETLEHLYFPKSIVNRVSLLLKSGGIFAGSVPNAFSLKNRIRLLLGKKENTSLADPTHINHFNFNELESLLLTSFKKVKIYPLIQPKYRYLSKVSPSLFSYQMLFCAHKN